MRSHVSGRLRAPMELDEARLWARAGVLAALALVLSYIETFIPLPVPVPGVKLGLANVVVLLALEVLDVKTAAVIALVKVLAAGLMFGNPVMMLYSAGGTVLAFASMALLTRIRGLSVVLAAIVGAILHNMGQLAVASLMLGTPLVWASAPLLIIAACATGALSGAATRYALTCLNHKRGQSPFMILSHSTGRQSSGDARRCVRARECVAMGGSRQNHKRGLSPFMTGGLDAKSEVEASGRLQGGAPRDLAERLGAVDARLKLAALVAYVVAALHVRTPLALGVCAALALAFALATRLPARTVARTLRPLSAILGITVLMQVLYLQQGEALAWVGPIAVTREALVASGRMVAALVCIMVASVAFMRCTPPEQLLGVLRWALRPAYALGWRSEALMLSLTVAFRFVPVLVGELSQLKRALESRGQSFDVGGVRARLRAYTLLFAPLVRNSFRRADMLAQAFVARCFASGPEPTSLQDAESHR